MAKAALRTRSKKKQEELVPAYPIQYWSHSSLMAFLRNPLAWYKRYVAKIYDTPGNPSSIVGRAAHLALQHFYGGIDKEGAINMGLEYLREVPEFEINFGAAKSKKARKARREKMERDYLQAVGFYLEQAPKHNVLGVEVRAMAQVDGIPIPIKAISDLVVISKVDKNCVDVVDHKFVAAFSKDKAEKTLFMMQALFNYYTVKQQYGKEVRRFIVYECKVSKNADGAPQMRRYVIDFGKRSAEFKVFHRLLRDATEELLHKRRYLPNPSDMFEGENSFDIYRLGLLDD